MIRFTLKRRHFLNSDIVATPVKMPWQTSVSVAEPDSHPKIIAGSGDLALAALHLARPDLARARGDGDDPRFGAF